MEKIPTAEEFLGKNIDYVLGKDCKEDVERAMIGFARIHVEAALKEASEKINLTDEVCEALRNHWFKEYIDKESLINSYPLENIK